MIRHLSRTTQQGLTLLYHVHIDRPARTVSVSASRSLGSVTPSSADSPRVKFILSEKVEDLKSSKTKTQTKTNNSTKTASPHTNTLRPHNKAMSRLPPLPPGMPPRPSGPPGAYGGDSYRPPQGDRYSNYPPPPPPEPMYRFRGAAQQPSYDRSPPRGNYAPGTRRSPPPGDSYRPTWSQNPPSFNYDRPGPGAFAFRQEAPPGIDYSRADTYRPRSPVPSRDRQDKKQRRNPRARNDNGGASHGGMRGGYRGRGGPKGASDREFLKTNREPTPELMPCMDDGAIHYIPVDDVSDSDDAAMDTGSEDENAPSEQPKKKLAAADLKASDGDNLPRWCNPDPYTVLPPIDDAGKKKKDMVKLIRKARVAVSAEHPTKTAAATDDFISFDDLGDNLFTDKPPSNKPAQLPPFKFGGALNGVRERSPQNIPLGPAKDYRLATVKYPGRAGSPVSHPEHAVKGSEGSMHEVMPTSNGQFGPRFGATQSNQQPGSMVSTEGPSRSSGKGKDAPIISTSDPSLGSRKRNFRDQLKPPPNIHEPSFGKKPPPSSHVIKSVWKAKPGVTPTPWISVGHTDSATMGNWLHREIMDFYHFVKPRQFEQLVRQDLIDNLRKDVLSYDANAEIHPFGSFPAKLYLPTADMDLVCVSKQYMEGGYGRYDSKRALWKFKDFLVAKRIPLLGTVEVIIGAKVPLVKYVDKITGLKVDISFENTTGLVANKTFRDWAATYPAMPILVTLIKHLLSMRGLNEPVNGGIGGFSITCLVVSLLQLMPQVQSGSMVADHHLGDILMDFLDLYGNQFNVTTTAISLNPPGYISKSKMNLSYKGGQREKFAIMDPNREDNDIAGGSSNTPMIRRCFSDAYNSLQHRMAEMANSIDHPDPSVLGCIIGGDYSTFHLQREHLAHVNEVYYHRTSEDVPT